MKWVFAIIKGRFLWIASLSFVDRLILGTNFFSVARVRYYLPECSVQGLALGPNMVCCPERGETEIMNDLCTFSSSISELNQMVW